MSDFLKGGVKELEEAKKAIVNEAEVNLASDEAASAYKAKEKELNAQKMFMGDKIASSIKNRRSELEKENDSKIKEAERDVKEARKTRKDALSEAVKERTKKETADLHEENKKLKQKNREILKEGNVPVFCNNKFYFAVFVPRTGFDFLILAISIVIAAVLIPNVVCAFLDWHIAYKALLYVGIVVFFVLIYFLITIWTKSGEKSQVLENCRPQFKAIKANKKAIRKMEKNIKKDNNEEQYGLEEYDKEIEKCEADLKDLKSQKEQALNEFDTRTSAQIKKKIEDELMPDIEKLAREAAELDTEAQTKKKAAEAATDSLRETYVIYLDEKYTNCEKIDEMIALINNGKASNIEEALNILKGENK